MENKKIIAVKKAVEKLIKSRPEVRSISGWKGKELKVELEDISNGKDERAYIKFEINDDETKYRFVSSLNAFSDLVGKTYDMSTSKRYFV